MGRRSSSIFVLFLVFCMYTISRSGDGYNIGLIQGSQGATTRYLLLPQLILLLVFTLVPILAAVVAVTVAVAVAVASASILVIHQENLTPQQCSLVCNDRLPSHGKRLVDGLGNTLRHFSGLIPARAHVKRWKCDQESAYQLLKIPTAVPLETRYHLFVVV